LVLVVKKRKNLDASGRKPKKHKKTQKNAKKDDPHPTSAKKR
jgi:hypothetical protein